MLPATCDLRLTVIVDQILDITHNLCIALVCVCGDTLEPLAMFLVDHRRLGMQHKGNCQQALELLSSGSRAYELTRDGQAYLDPFDLERRSDGNIHMSWSVLTS